MVVKKVEIIPSKCKEITGGCGKSMVVMKPREVNDYFLGIGEWQVVREVINADLGRARKVSKRQWHSNCP